MSYADILRQDSVESFSQSDIDSIKKAIGPELDNIEVYNNQILIGIYIRPEKTKSGLYLASKTLDEDRWQGKVGVVLKKGPSAFVDEGSTIFHGQNVNVGDWIVFRTSDGFQLKLGSCHCRLLEDIHVRLRVPAPDVVW